MHAPALTLSLVALLLGACAAQTGAGEPTEAAGAGGARASDESAAAHPSDHASELRARGRPKAGPTRTLTGTLGADASLEGGCAWLEAGGQRWQVLYPDGYRLDVAGGRLFGPDGEVARSGDTLTVRGRADPDMATTCQVGPVFRAVAVEG